MRMTVCESVCVEGCVYGHPIKDANSTLQPQSGADSGQLKRGITIQNVAAHPHHLLAQPCSGTHRLRLQWAITQHHLILTSGSRGLRHPGDRPGPGTRICPIINIGEQLCKQLHATGMLTIGTHTQIVGLKPNQTDSRSVTLAGSLGTDGTCSGTQYSDPFGTSEGYCLDTDGGDTYWSSLPEDSCHFNKYDVLYEGKASRLSPSNKTNGPIIYTVTTQETTFALARTTEFSICGYTILKTEHPKLFIMETGKGNTFRIPGRLSVDNLDIFSYVNSKFLYVEKHIRTQITQLYRDVLRQKCALEEQILKNALAFASFAPDEVAYSIMKAPGYMAVTAGEAIHIIKCIPIDPKSRILTKQAVERECNELLPIMYRIHGRWFHFEPKPMESLELPTISPLTKPNWKYTDPEHLASSGIYNPGDLDKLRDHIMFPVEKPAMLNTLARGAMGQDIAPGSVSLYHLLDENSLDKIAESTGHKIWSWFITFGTASAGVIAVIMIIRLMKIIADTLIHGYALHSVYGWSIHLLGAVWSSLTHLLIRMAERPEQRQQQQQPQEQELSQPPAEVRRTSPLEPSDASVKVTKNSEVFSYAELSNKLADVYP